MTDDYQPPPELKAKLVAATPGTADWVLYCPQCEWIGECCAAHRLSSICPECGKPTRQWRHSRTAFFATMSAKSARTGELITDKTLVSGPVSTRELAQKICDVERKRRDHEEAGAMRRAGITNPPVIFTFDVVEREVVEMLHFWDDTYTDNWFALRLAPHELVF